MKYINVTLDKEGVGLNFNKKANALTYDGRYGKPYIYDMPRYRIMLNMEERDI